MQRLWLGIVAMGLLQSGVSRAYEANLGFDLGLGYRSNVLNRSNNPVGDGLLRFRPNVRLSHEWGRGSWQVQYRPEFEGYLRLNRASRWDHALNLNVDYQLSPRLGVSLNDSFRQQSNGRGVFFDDEPIEADVGRQRRTTNRLGLGFRRRFTPRLQGLANASYNFISRCQLGTGSNCIEALGRSSESLTGTTSLSYVLGRKTSAGGGFSYAYRSFANPNSSNRSYTYATFLSVNHSFSDTLQLSISLGPAYVRTTGFFRVVNPFPPPDTFSIPFDDSSWSIFGSARLSKSWRRWTAVASYERNDSPSTDAGRNTIINRVDFTLSWARSALWRFNLRGTFQQREGIILQDLTLSRVAQVRGSVERRLSLRSRVSLATSYRYQESRTRGILPVFFDSNEYRLTLSFRHDLEPISFSL